MLYLTNGILLLWFLASFTGLFRIFAWPAIKVWIHEHVTPTVKLDFFNKPDYVSALNYSAFLIIFVGVSIGYVVYFNFLGFSDFFSIKSSDVNSFIGAVATIAMAVSGWIFANRVQLINSIKQHSLNILLNSRLSEEYMMNARSANEFFILNKNNPNKIKLADIQAMRFDIVCQARLRHAIFYLLNYFEFIAIAIRNRDLDEDLIKLSWKGIIVGNYDFFSEVIQEMRLAQSSNFENLTALYHRWK